MKLGWDLASGLNRNLTAWTSESDPSPGPYTAAMDLHGDPQCFIWAGAARVWRSGPWNGVELNGIPEMKTTPSMVTTDYTENSDEVCYGFHSEDPSVVSRLIMNQSGQLQRLMWLETSRTWKVFWLVPKDQCDNPTQCGPYGLCDVDGSPVCNCLPGFEPKSPVNWALRDGSDGCVRRTALDCRNGTDGFVTVGRTKPPDTSSVTVDRSMTLDDCRAACLANCSCTAYASFNLSGSGSGCIIWTTELTDIRVYSSAGQDLYLRLAAADLGSTPDRKRGISVVVIVVAVVLPTLLLGLVSWCMWRKTKRKGTISFSDRGNDLELPLFDLGTIAAATDNFSLQNKLGEGGFGPVYKGKLGEGLQIAVKRLAKTSIQGAGEFKNEAMLIAKLQHRNLVRLLGCCVQGEERMLIYEYMRNKSLDMFLFDKEKRPLDWPTRYNIIGGIARGLLYLHQDSRFRIIHRDLKPSNILLDEELNPKISDFGMARIFGGDESELNTKKVVGTYGYMSPEYAIDGIFSVKSDVFSFGVLVLEIVSGKKNRGVYASGNHQYLLEHAWNLWKEGNGLELVDESIGSAFSMYESLRCIKVGLLCVQDRPEDRPPMASVVFMLDSEGASIPHPKQPGFVATKGSFEMGLPVNLQGSRTMNEVSVTMLLEGR